jgi:hypothetical protein
MDKNQINNALQIINNIEAFEIDKILETNFKDKDITTSSIGVYSAPDFIVSLKRMVNQFK